MKLNTTSQYAIRIMAHIAKEGDKEFHNAKDISEALDISYKYLTRVMAQLVSAKLLTSTRGREGGYFLSKKPHEIKILDILATVKEAISDRECVLGTGMCTQSNKCSLHDQWMDPKQSMIDMFNKTTLADMR